MERSKLISELNSKIAYFLISAPPTDFHTWGSCKHAVGYSVDQIPSGTIQSRHIIHVKFI